mgnify:FL=1
MRNIISLLKQFDLIEHSDCYLYPKFDSFDSTINKLKHMVMKTKEMLLIAKIMKEQPNILGSELGKIINKQFDYKWKPASEVRIGNGLRLWYENLTSLPN